MSLDVLRWWYRAGKRGGLRRVHAPGAGISPGLVHSERVCTGRALFAGVVRSVEPDGAMALVEIEAGPFLFRAAVSRDEVDELGLAQGSRATATVKGTTVMVEKGDLG